MTLVYWSLEVVVRRLEVGDEHVDRHTFFRPQPGGEGFEAARDDDVEAHQEGTPTRTPYKLLPTTDD